MLEPLERREMMAADVRSIDGTGNNVQNPLWGSAGSDLLRKATTTSYLSDGMTPNLDGLPGARDASNQLFSQTGESESNGQHVSAFIYAWGQFLDHDLDLTPNGTTETLNIPVPPNDGTFDPTKPIVFHRSVYDALTGTGADNARQQLNMVTSFLDGSQIYGSDATRAAALRGDGGHLKTSDGNLLPFNTDLLPNANDAHLFPPEKLFLAGDVRANENVELTSLQTLFMREHNRLVDQMAARDKSLGPDDLYQRARAIVIAELQAITYNEFLPALLGPNALSRYTGYKASVKPSIANEFSTVGFRFGHSMLDDDVQFMDNNGVKVHDDVPLANAFFNPALFEQMGTDPIFKYLASVDAQENDLQMVGGIRNELFGPPGSGLDLGALDIQRARDHGLTDYNSMRVTYGLRPAKSFADITSDVNVQNTLQTLYKGDISKVDAFVGGLAEAHVRGSNLGPLFQRILVDQFQRLRDGDRYWYQNTFSGKQLYQLENTHLSDVILRNATTPLTNLQENVFVFDPVIRGRVVLAGSRFDLGLPGITIQLEDPTGNVLATTTTGRNGAYAFDGLVIGTYRIRAVLPAGAVQVTRDPAEIAITRGMAVSHIDFGLRLKLNLGGDGGGYDDGDGDAFDRFAGGTHGHLGPRGWGA